MDAPVQRVPTYQTNPILARQTPEKNSVRGAEVGAEIGAGVVRVGVPNIESWLNKSGFNPYEFRLLGRISRRAGRHGAAFETVANIAAGCRMNERTTQRYLRKLLAEGFICIKRPATPKTATYYGLTREMHVGDKELLAMFTPAWLDDLQLTPQAFRLLYHYISCSYGGQIKADHSCAVYTCGIYRPGVRAAEAELVERGLLEFREKRGGQSVFRVTCLPDPSTETQVVDTVTPSCLLSHPSLSTESPKGLVLKSSLKAEADGGEKNEDGRALLSSDTEVTPPHHGKTSREGKALHSSNQDAATLHATEKPPQESEVIHFFHELVDPLFIQWMRRMHPNNANDLLERWYKKRGSEFVSKAWEVAKDPTYRVEGKAATWLFVDYLSGRRDLPTPLLRLEEKAKKERTERKRAAQIVDLHDGDLFEVDRDTQTYAVHGEPARGFVIGVLPGQVGTQGTPFPAEQCKAASIHDGDVFRCSRDGKEYVAHGEPTRVWVDGIKPGEDWMTAEKFGFRPYECKLVRRAPPYEPQKSAPPAPAPEPAAEKPLEKPRRSGQTGISPEVMARWEAMAKDPELQRAHEVRKKERLKEAEAWVASWPS